MHSTLTLPAIRLNPGPPDQDQITHTPVLVGGEVASLQQTGLATPRGPGLNEIMGGHLGDMALPLPLPALNSLITTVLGLSLVVVAAAWWLYRQAYGTDIPKISGLPEAPGAVPFYGHLKALGDDHPTVFEEWGKQFNWPVMQARMGAKRVIVLNSYEAAQEWMVRNASATIDRPLFYTFANVVSTSQGMCLCMYLCLYSLSLLGWG